MEVSKRTILVTGATGGIGKALALEYASPRVRLILLGRDQASLNVVWELCQKQGAEVKLYCVDLSDIKKSIEVSSKISKCHKVDLFISNAGLTNNTQDGKIEEWEAIESLLTVNLLGALAISHSVLEEMQRRKTGHIAYVSSLGAYYGMPLTPAYSASKAGLKAYAEAMRGLLAKHSVSVTLITPGFVKTSLSDQFPGDKPFMISAEQAARRIKNGLDKKHRVITFPLLLSLGMRLLAFLPARLADSILSYLKY